LLAVLFVAELIPVTVWLDGGVLMSRGGLFTFIAIWGPWLLRALITFSALLTTFVICLRPDAVKAVSSETDSLRLLNGRYLTAHFGSLAIFLAFSASIYGNRIADSAIAPVALAWLASGVCAGAMAGLAVLPLPYWLRLWRDAGSLTAYALVTTLVVCLVGFRARDLWRPSAVWTFVLVERLLKLFLSNVLVNTSTMSIGSSSFQVEIAPQCSGLEGAALMLGFCTLWLWMLRREFRFPHALLLAPAGVLLLFFLNALRITALILIGNAGAREIALGGFHSQAGWIAFNAVAIGLVLASRRIQWITTGHTESSVEPAAEPTSHDNPAAPYLAPFLLILAAAMISNAASSGFEWLYPVRFFAAGAALWRYRRCYGTLDWRFGWEAPVVGTLVCALWMTGDWLSGVHPQNPLIRNADPRILIAQNIWLVFRIAAAVVTVPIAEELAFRGYLIRRILSADFESLSPQAYTIVSLLVSSLVFGALHGSRWIAGTVAGLLYAMVYIRRGRIGDPVAAHAVTNGLLAASVVFTGQWNLS
jgi:exosortase E/protease (VPEID-CTERM system)